MIWNEYTCKCGARVISRAMEDQFKADAAAKKEVYIEESLVKLKAEDGFVRNLRKLKKNVARARKARKAFYAMCRARRTVFIEETRPFVERIHELQKEGVKGVRAAPESKQAHKEYLSVRRTLRSMERAYPLFSPDKDLFRKLRLPTPWDVRYTMQFSTWKVRRFFRTVPMLF